MAVESKSLLHQEVTRTIEPVLTLAAEALKLERALTDLVIEGSLSSPLKNYGYRCFSKNGPPTRRDEGAYPSRGRGRTEEQPRRLAVFGETLWAEALLSWFFVVRRSQIHEGYARSSLREPGQNISQQQCP